MIAKFMIFLIMCQTDSHLSPLVLHKKAEYSLQSFIHFYGKKIRNFLTLRVYYQFIKEKYYIGEAKIQDTDINYMIKALVIIGKRDPILSLLKHFLFFKENKLSIERICLQHFIIMQLI